MWSSKSRESYLCLTAHWLAYAQKVAKEDLQLRSAIIAFHRFVGHHTGINIANTILQLLARVGIEKLTPVCMKSNLWLYALIVITIQGSHFTVDNASNNSTFIQEIEKIHRVKYHMTWKADEAQVSCFPHTLNICTQRTVRALESLPLGPPASNDSDGSDSDDDDGDGNNSDGDGNDSDGDGNDSDGDGSSDGGDGDGDDQSNKKSPIHKLRALIRGIRASDQRQTAFKEIILAGNTYGWWRDNSDVPGEQGAIIQITPKQLILDVRTRWSSTYLMLRRALELRDVSAIFLMFSMPI